MKNKDLPPYLLRCAPSQRGTSIARFDYLQRTFTQIPDSFKQTYIKMYYREIGLMLVKDQ